MSQSSCNFILTAPFASRVFASRRGGHSAGLWPPLGWLLCLAIPVQAGDNAAPIMQAPPEGPALAYILKDRVYTVDTLGRWVDGMPRPPENSVQLWQGPLLLSQSVPIRKFPLRVGPPRGPRQLYRWRVFDDCFWGTGAWAGRFVDFSRIPLGPLPEHNVRGPDSSFCLLPVWLLACRNAEAVGFLVEEYATRDAWFDFLIGDKGEVQTLVAWHGHLRAWRGVLHLGLPADAPSIRWDNERDRNATSKAELILSSDLPDIKPVLSARTDVREPFHAFQDAEYFYLVTASGLLHACPRRGEGQRSRVIWEDGCRPIRCVVCDSATGRAWAFTAAAGPDAPSVWFQLGSKIRPAVYEAKPAMEVKPTDPLPSMLAYARFLHANSKLSAGASTEKHRQRLPPRAGRLERGWVGGHSRRSLLPARRDVNEEEAKDWTDLEAPRPDPAEERAAETVRKWGATVDRDWATSAKTVVGVYCWGPPGTLTEADLKQLVAFKHLRILLLHLTVTDAHIKALASLQNLEKLDLCNNTKVTDAGLKELAPLKELRILRLANTEVTDAGLKELAAFQKLRALDVGETAVTGRGFKPLASLKHLHTLRLRSSTVPDAGLNELAALPQLRTLDLSGNGLSDATLKRVAVLVQLERLDLGGNQVTDAGLKELAALKQLRSLDLGGNWVTDAGLKELASLKQLRILKLGDTKTTDAGLKVLTGMPQLQALSLGSGVTDAGLRDLAAATQLQELGLGGTKVTDAGLRHLSAFKHLKSLDLQGTAVTDEGLKYLLALWELRDINLQETKVTRNGIDFLRKALPDCETTLDHMGPWWQRSELAREVFPSHEAIAAPPEDVP
jgi:internalin A